MPRGARIPRDVPTGNRKPNPRLSPGHLEFIRQLPCLSCGKRPPSTAAHLRFATADEPLKPGTGLKPPDFRAVPLCAGCHLKEEDGKLTFWGGCMAKGISDPIAVAERLRRISGDLDRGFQAIAHARPGLKTAWLPS